MRDITEIMNHYRSVARSIWNEGFWIQPALRHWDSWDRFDEIRALLFDGLVAAAIEEDRECCPKPRTPQDLKLRVEPNGSWPVPIQISHPREGDRNNYWDDPVREVRATEVELEFLDYFDWDKMNFIDFHYYRVRILKFDPHPHLVGSEALLQHQYAKVLALDAPDAKRESTRT